MSLCGLPTKLWLGVPITMASWSLGCLSHPVCVIGLGVVKASRFAFSGHNFVVGFIPRGLSLLVDLAKSRLHLRSHPCLTLPLP